MVPEFPARSRTPARRRQARCSREYDRWVRVNLSAVAGFSGISSTGMLHGMSNAGGGGGGGGSIGPTGATAASDGGRGSRRTNPALLGRPALLEQAWTGATGATGPTGMAGADGATGSNRADRIYRSCWRRSFDILPTTPPPRTSAVTTDSPPPLILQRRRTRTAALRERTSSKTGRSPAAALSTSQPAIGVSRSCRQIRSWCYYVIYAVLEAVLPARILPRSDKPKRRRALPHRKSSTKWSMPTAMCIPCNWTVTRGSLNNRQWNSYDKPVHWRLKPIPTSVYPLPRLWDRRDQLDRPERPGRLGRPVCWLNGRHRR